MDEFLEEEFKMAIPFLDLRLGVQGVGESFTFIISSMNPRTSLQSIYSEPKKELTKFFNDMNWKVSSYLSTIMGTFALSCFVSIIEEKEKRIQMLVKDWLYLLINITEHPGFPNLSLSVLSKLMLKEEYNINSTARDVILKPILYYLNLNRTKSLVEEWSELILDTYNHLKAKKAFNAKSTGDAGFASPSTFGSDLNSPAEAELAINFEEDDHKLINQYFGELEIRGLIIISYFSLYYAGEIDQDIARRSSKLIIILTREIVEKFQNNKKYIHLLAILLQLISTGMKIYHMTYKNTKILEDIIKLLLAIFNSYKPPINVENFITRIAEENYHLIKPAHPDLFLKLTAAK